MTWLTVDDNFADHPKVEALSDKAFRLHMSGLCYCAKHMTNGKVSTSRVTRLVGFTGRALTELVESGVWHRAGSEGYEIHDYLDWNESREQILTKRHAAKERQRKHRESRVTDPVTDSVSHTSHSTPLHSTVLSPTDKDKTKHLAVVSE